MTVIFHFSTTNTTNKSTRKRVDRKGLKIGNSGAWHHMRLLYENCPQIIVGFHDVNLRKFAGFHILS